MTVHVAIDIETASTRQDAAILSIGWAEFRDARIVESGHVAIEDWDNYEGHVSAKALAWWAVQPDAARLAAFAPEAPAKFFSALAAIPKGDLYWGDPPSFDLGIIDAQAQRAGLERWVPWTHRNQRCARTYRDGRARIHEPAIPHHPKHDAIALALNLIAWGIK